MNYYVLYKHTPKELKGQPDKGSFHPAWGEDYQGWHSQSLCVPTLEKAHECVKRCILPYGRQWRIIELEEKDGIFFKKSIQTSPEVGM